jgi:hypothetical protein
MVGAMVTDKMKEILSMLERMTSMMEKRIEKIEKGIKELHEKKKVEETREGGDTHGSVRPGTFKCTLGRTLLMLGLVAPAASSEMRSGDKFRNDSRRMKESRRKTRRRNLGWSDDLNSAYIGIRALLEVAEENKIKLTGNSTGKGNLITEAIVRAFSKMTMRSMEQTKTNCGLS